MPSRTQTRARGPRTDHDTEDRSLVVFDPKEKAQKLVAALDERRDQIGSFLASDPKLQDRFLNVAIDAIVRDQNLLSADLLSLVASVRHAAIMGLEPTSVMGEGAIVVYRDSGAGKKIAQFQPMVRGLQKLARNSGEIAAIGVDVVRARDHFRYQSGSDPKIEHEPWITGLSGEEDPGEVIGAYAYLRLKTGELLPMFMSTAEILKRRAVSKSYRNSGERSIWGQWPEEMMKKTVLRRLLMERAPLSFRAQRALALDAEIDSVDGDPVKVEAALSRTASRALLADVGGGDETQHDGSGAAAAGDAGTDTVSDASGAPEGSDAVTEGQAADAPECPAAGCIRDVHADNVSHRNAIGETWFDE